MITHKIIKHKSRKVVELPNIQQGHSINIMDRMSITTTRVCPLGVQPTQGEFDAYVNGMELKRGDYVVGRHSQSPCLSGYSIHCVINTVKTINEVKSWLNGHPKAWILLQLWKSDGTPPWIHYENILDYRKITDQEYSLFVEPTIDNIRNHIQEYQHASPA